MREFINYLTQYTALLKEGAVWKNSKEILAPVISEQDEGLASDNYIYEFFCYINLIVDLREEYEIEFIEGAGDFKFKFPRAAAGKKGKPRFHAYKEGKLEFQICAGTKVSCELDSEENHPDISFQIHTASENPTHEDLIIIMDAKYREKPESSLPKIEVYKFSMIVQLFQLTIPAKKAINFTKFKKLEGNCLITNGKAYSDSGDVNYLKKFFIKEVESFYPKHKFSVLG